MLAPPRFSTSRYSGPAGTSTAIRASGLAGDWPSLCMSTWSWPFSSESRMAPPPAWTCATSFPSAVGLTW